MCIHVKYIKYCFLYFIISNLLICNIFNFVIITILALYNFRFYKYLDKILNSPFKRFQKKLNICTLNILIISFIDKKWLYSYMCVFRTFLYDRIHDLRDFCF